MNNNTASHIIDNVFGVIAQPPVMPAYLPCRVTLHGVEYVGKLYPVDVEVEVMTATQYEELVSKAKLAGVDVTSGAEYREKYA